MDEDIKVGDKVFFITDYNLAHDGLPVYINSGSVYLIITRETRKGVNRTYQIMGENSLTYNRVASKVVKATKELEQKLQPAIERRRLLDEGRVFYKPNLRKILTLKKILKEGKTMVSKEALENLDLKEIFTSSEKQND